MNSESAMAIKVFKQFHEKESLIALLKIIAMGEKDRLQGNTLTIEKSRQQLESARDRRKQSDCLKTPVEKNK